jgi:hypothetical protein
MEVKGTAIKTTRDFVKVTFPSMFNEWIDSLPEQTRTVYTSPMVNMSGWFPMKDHYQLPMEKIIELFYAGDTRVGCEALGRFSADLALNGIYKLFLLVATPKYLMTRASVAFSTYYLPSDIKVSESGDKSVTMQITEFPEMSLEIEHRIIGWCVRALELCGCKMVIYRLMRSLTKGESLTEVLYSWE